MAEARHVALVEADRLDARLAADLLTLAASLFAVVLAVALSGTVAWVAAVPAAAGAAAAYLVHRLKQRDDALTRLRQRCEDEAALCAVLGAEIADNIEQAQARYDVMEQKEITLRMEREPDWTPFQIVDTASRTVFAANRSRLSLLPQATPRVVVAYYSADAGLNSALSAFRAEDFLALAPERRRTFVARTYELSNAICDVGPADAHGKAEVAFRALLDRNHVLSQVVGGLGARQSQGALGVFGAAAAGCRCLARSDGGQDGSGHGLHLQRATNDDSGRKSPAVSLVAAPA